MRSKKLENFHGIIFRGVISALHKDFCDEVIDDELANHPSKSWEKKLQSTSRMRMAQTRFEFLIHALGQYPQLASIDYVNNGA